MTQAGPFSRHSDCSQLRWFRHSKVFLKMIALCLLFTLSQSQASISVNPVSKTINTNTTYQFTIADSVIRTVSSTQAVIQISFPSSLFTFDTAASYTCANTDTPSTLYTCRASTTNVIQINNPLISTVVFKVSISLIKNPSSTEQATFGYLFKYTNGTIISQNSTDIFQKYSPGNLLSCTASFNPNTVHTTSEITVSIVLGNEVKRNGSVYVTFPSAWSDSASSIFLPIISTATQTCTRKSSNNFLLTFLSCSTIGNQVLLTNSLNNTAPSGSSLSFSISNILSPPTINIGNSIVLTTTTQTNAQIDKMTCIIDAVTTKTIAGINPSVSLTVGTSTEFIFDFLAPTPIASGDHLMIEAISPNDSYFSLSASNTVDVLYNALSLTVDSSNSTALTLAFPSMSSVIPASTKIGIIQGLFVKPLISSGAKSLALTLRRGSYNYASQSFALTISPNILQSTSINLSTSVVSSTASYIFVMTLSNNLATKSRVVLTLPNQLSLANGVCSASASALINPSSINSSLACNVASSKIITLTAINTNALAPGQKLTITINNILNSDTTETTDIFTINTFYGQTSTDPTDYSSNQTVKMTAATIGVASVSNLLPRVAQETVYTISYTVKTKFLSNSKIRIGLPSEISVGATLSAFFSLTYTNSTTTPEQSCPVTPLTLNSVQYLELGSISASVLPASTVIIIKINSLANPTSLKPSSSFKIIQLDSKGYEIQKLQTGLTVTNSQTNSFPVFYAAQSNVRMNGESSIYTLNIKSAIDLALNDYFEIALDTATSKNSQIYFSNPITSCDITYVLNGVTIKLISTVERISSTLLKVSLGQSMPSSRTYQISINTIQRPRTQETPNSLTVRSFKYVSSSLSYGISSGTLSPKENNKRNTIQSVSLNILTNPSQLFSFQSFAVSVTPKIPLLSGDYFVIDVPNLYSYSGSVVTVTPSTNLLSVASQSLCIQSDFYCSHFSADPYKIKVQEFSTTFSGTTSVTVTIKNNFYRSPSTFSYTGYYFKATSYASNNLMIDQTVTSGTPTTTLTNAEFSVTCKSTLSTHHCMTCTANGSCNSCYQPVTVNSTLYTLDGFQFLTSDAKCLSECGLGYFINSGTNICTRCDSPCATCQTTSSTCLTCLQNVTTNKYFSGNKTCLSLCPDGYFSDAGNICLQCSSACATCMTDSGTCSSCPSGTFLNSNTKACVTSTNCPTGTYADSTTNKCTTCHVSCTGCVSQATNCLTCATGYITDFTNSTFTNCTNVCPPGKVNDTVNGLGCRCETQCKTCEGTISTCKTCDSTSIYKYFYGTTCLISCPQATYSSTITATSSDICVDCPESNCKTCDSSNCYQCIGQYALYQGRCVQTCPTASVLEVESGVRKCTSCSIGCLNCDLGAATCTTCSTGYLKESNSVGSFCTTSCSSGMVNFNNSICYSACPDGYENVNQVCRLSESNSTDTSKTEAQSALSTTRRVPFPFIIASFVLLVIILLSKLVLPTSIVSTLLTTIVGVLEPLSWIVSVVVCVMQTSEGQHWGACSVGVYLIIVGLVLNFVLNIVALVFFWKYILKDPKFSYMMNYNEKKVFMGRCPTTSVLILSVLASHKILQLLFSNFLSSRHFSYKLQTVTRMNPLNYVIFVSILPSFLSIAGGCKISYQLQNYSIDSSAFIAALDMILVTVLGIVASLWATNRKSEDYEKQISGTQHEKHYQTEEILVEGHVQDASENLNEVFMEQSGVRRLGNDGKNYFYNASRVKQQGEVSHDNAPLTKRQTARNPINQSNRNKLRGTNFSDEQSSEALVINEKQKRRNLKDEFQQDSGQDHKASNSDDMEVIDLQKKNQNETLKSDDLKDMPLISKIHYPNKQKKQKPEELLKMSNQEKQSLKQKIQSQLAPQQKEKLNVLNKQKDLKIKKKKQKIEQILKINQGQKADLANEEKVKLDNIKEAVDLLKRKEIKIEEYLLYAQIIKEEEGQYDEESEQQISQIDQKAHTIIKGFQDEDQELQEVINLSPKRKIINSKQGLSQSQSRTKQKNKSPQKQDGQVRLQRSKSNDNKFLQKQKKSTSKQKTIKKQSNTANKNGKKQKKNKVKPPNDLQVNYNMNDDLNGNPNNEDSSFDSEEEPQLPKNRSNIIEKGNKNRNRSEKQLNPKKGLYPNHGDIMMIDMGMNRHNMTQNQISHFGSNQLEDDHGDALPPHNLRSTQKVDFSHNRMQDMADRNIYDSQNERETMKSFDNPDLDFYNQISPSQFGVQNKRFDNIETQELPIKPNIIVENMKEHDTTMQKKAKSPIKNDGFDIYQGDELDEENYQSKVNFNNTLNRTASQIKDYNSIIIRKTMQNDKLRALQKIYMPKDKKNKPRRDASTSKISSRKD